MRLYTNSKSQDHCEKKIFRPPLGITYMICRYERVQVLENYYDSKNIRGNHTKKQFEYKTGIYTRLKIWQKYQFDL